MSDPSPSRRPRGIPALGLTVLLVLLAVPAVRFAIDTFGDSPLMVDLEWELGDSRSHMSWSDGFDYGLDTWITGEVRLTADADGIEPLDSGSALVVRERRRFQRRTVAITRGDDGELAYRYRHNGREQPMDEAAHRWLTQVLPKVRDRTGLGVEELSRDLLADGGPEAVLARIERFESDFARTIAYRVLLDEGELDDGQLARVAVSLDRNIESDYHLSETLLGLLEKSPDRPLRAPLFAAVRGLESDYYLTQLLNAIVDPARELPPSAFDELLTSIGELDSDYYRRELSLRLLKRPDLSDDQLAGILTVGRRFETDYSRGLILTAAVEELVPRLARRDEYGAPVPAPVAVQSTATGEAAIEATDEAAAGPTDEAAPEPTAPPAAANPASVAFFTLLHDVESEYHRREIIGRAVELEPPPAFLHGLLKETERLENNFPRGELLVGVAAAADRDRKVLDEVLLQGATLPDPFLVKLCEELLRRDLLPPDLLPKLTEIVEEEIAGEYERDQLLARLARRTA